MSEAEAVVQEQVEAFNARDTERFVACYADAARIVGPDCAVMLEGTDAIREQYGQVFVQSPELHVAIPARIAVGDYVIEEERAFGMVAEDMPFEAHAAVVYHVTEGKIDKVQMYR